MKISIFSTADNNQISGFGILCLYPDPFLSLRTSDTCRTLAEIEVKEISFLNILIDKYGKSFILFLSIITIAVLLFTSFTGLSLYQIMNKYFLLEERGKKGVRQKI